MRDDRTQTILRLGKAAGWVLALGALFGCGVADPGEGTAGLELGTRLPNLLRAGRLLNAPVDVAAPTKGWIVYAFSPGSPLCEQNSPRVEDLARALPPQWGLLSVSTDQEGLRPFLERLHVAVPVLAQVPERDLEKYRISKTPRSYVLTEDWKLLEVLDGPYEGEVASKLAKRLDVERPTPSMAGVAQPQQSSRGFCLDNLQRPYSPGARADAFGQGFECGPDGAWVPVV